MTPHERRQAIYNIAELRDRARVFGNFKYKATADALTDRANRLQRKLDADTLGSSCSQPTLTESTTLGVHAMTK